MRRDRALWSALAVVVAGLPALPSAAFGPPEGRKCGFNSVVDVTAEPGWQVGHINGGPLAHDEPGHITCSIQVNGVDVLSVDGSDSEVSVLAPTLIRYRATAADSVSICTSYTSGGVTLYWSAGTAIVDGYWSNEKEPCGVALSIEPEGAHDVVSRCTYRVHEPTGTVTVVGKTKAIRHPRADTTTIRCRLEDRGTGTPMFDESRTANDDTVVLQSTFFAVVGDVRVCSSGAATWPDGHDRDVRYVCA